MGAEEIDFEEDARRHAPKVYLLDTCTLLWATNEPEQLSGPARAILHEPNGIDCCECYQLLGDRD